MTQSFNYQKFASSPASTGELINNFKQSVNWSALSPFEQNTIRREITRQVTDELHEAIKKLRSQVHDTIKVSGLDEKSELYKILVYVGELDVLVQMGRQSF